MNTLIKWLSVALLIGCTNASAYFYTGNKLKEYLEEHAEKKGGVGAGIGLGFVVGIHDADINIFFCSPDKITVGQLGEVVLKYLRGHPEQLQLRAYALTRLALREAWPCPVKQETPAVPKPKPPPKAVPKPQQANPF